MATVTNTECSAIELGYGLSLPLSFRPSNMYNRYQAMKVLIEWALDKCLRYVWFE